VLKDRVQVAEQFLGDGFVVAVAAGQGFHGLTRDRRP
jgi:hypothetical protein